MTAPALLTDLYAARRTQLIGLAKKSLVATSVATAEDLVQDAFLKVWRYWERLEAPDDAVKVLAYLRQTVVHLVASANRHHLVAARHAGNPAVPTVAPSAEDDALARHLDADVLAAVLALPRQQRQAVITRHYLDLPEAQTAAELGVAVGSVKSYTSRGLAAARGQLTALAPVPDTGRPLVLAAMTHPPSTGWRRVVPRHRPPGGASFAPAPRPPERRQHVRPAISLP
jgi:RNA polymerase sigma factor (sigma-70 family)